MPTLPIIPVPQAVATALKRTAQARGVHMSELRREAYAAYLGSKRLVDRRTLSSITLSGRLRTALERRAAELGVSLNECRRRAYAAYVGLSEAAVCAEFERTSVLPVLTVDAELMDRLEKKAVYLNNTVSGVRREAYQFFIEEKES